MKRTTACIFLALFTASASASHLTAESVVRRHFHTRFMSVSKLGGGPETWKYQLNVNGRTHFVSIGESVVGWTAVDATPTSITLRRDAKTVVIAQGRSVDLESLWVVLYRPPDRTPVWVQAGAQNAAPQPGLLAKIWEGIRRIEVDTTDPKNIEIIVLSDRNGREITQRIPFSTKGPHSIRDLAHQQANRSLESDR